MHFKQSTWVDGRTPDVLLRVPGARQAVQKALDAVSRKHQVRIDTDLPAYFARHACTECPGRSCFTVKERSTRF